MAIALGLVVMLAILADLIVETIGLMIALRLLGVTFWHERSLARACAQLGHPLSRGRREPSGAALDGSAGDRRLVRWTLVHSDHGRTVRALRERCGQRAGADAVLNWIQRPSGRRVHIRIRTAPIIDGRGVHVSGARAGDLNPGCTPV
jgi:hypothetical protein